MCSPRSLLAVMCPLLLSALAACATSAMAAGWIRPVDGSVLRAFAVGPDRYAAGQHRGVDLAAAPGSPVRAACGGRVSFAGRVPGGGRTVSVRCGALVATYQHLGSMAVARGRVVMAGGPIGRSGRARPEAHVHLGARVATTGEYRDPLTLFTGAAPGPLPPVPLSRRTPPAEPARRLPPRPLGRAPAPMAQPAPAPALARLPAARPFAPAPAPAVPGAAGRLPWVVWTGLALVALGLPLGGGLIVAHRRRGAPVAGWGAGPARVVSAGETRDPGG
jgi:hypothetical protein